jgi:GT2 family glycosyltransferase
MQDKIKVLLEEIFTLHRKTLKPFRATLYPIIISIKNTIFENKSLVSVNTGTNIVLRLPKKSSYLKIITSIVSTEQTHTRLFYKSSKKDIFSKLDSTILGDTNKLNSIYLDTAKDISYLRLDAVDCNSEFSIKYFEIIKISKLEYKYTRFKKTLISIKNIIRKKPYLVKKFFQNIKTIGINESINKVKLKLSEIGAGNINNKYRYIAPEFTDIIKNKINNFKYTPLISIIIPVYNVEPIWLDLAIKSVENQWYKNWELCVVDDKSTHQDTINYLKKIKSSKIKVKFLEKNLNISGASNEAIKMANGEYIALLDNDDELTLDALYEVVNVVNISNADFIYSDEDFLTISGNCINPHYKPDFSPDLLLSHNYITHFSCFKKSLLDKVGLFNSKYDGAQDYDLFLRLTEKALHVKHIQRVLYHWRMIETSTSYNSFAKPEALNNGKLLLKDALNRRGIKGKIMNANLHHYYRIEYDLTSLPLVSIIIPFKDMVELLTVSITSILKKSTYENFEIIGISNNSNNKATFDEMKRLKKLDNRINFYEYNIEFNYSDINNYAVREYANGRHIILLNNDIEIISPMWIEEMLMYSQKNNIGVVGAKLYYPNDKIQHAGVIVGLGGYAAHSHKMYNRDNYGYFNRLNVVQNLSAVTAACLMVKKNIYEDMNGLNEIDFKIAYNDVDFCLRVLEKGYLNIFTPYCEAYHHESISRGYEETPEKIARFNKEKKALFDRHRAILQNGDPYYNSNLTLDREDFSLK